MNSLWPESKSVNRYKGPQNIRQSGRKRDEKIKKKISPLKSSYISSDNNIIIYYTVELHVRERKRTIILGRNRPYHTRLQYPTGRDWENVDDFRYTGFGPTTLNLPPSSYT